MENAKSENPHSCHKKRDFRLLFYFLLSKDLSGEIGIHTGSEKDTFRKRKTCLLCMNCFLGNLNLFHMWIKKETAKSGSD